VSKEYLTYEKGWDDAFGIIADYVEAEICLVTAEMIRRMKDEKWRFIDIKNEWLEDEDQ
jgi:hypothetical protein